MSKVADLHKKWMKDPEYQVAYNELEEEFELSSAIIAARDRAGLTQSELASLMEAKQSLVARLESGAQNTTIKMLKRIASATGSRLRISFDDTSPRPKRKKRISIS